ncbi:hypothetical protein L1887_50983 [Cichorium endivia]|nr:hypothetical protein L1887_50983 [Cichorium endivia]
MIGRADIEGSKSNVAMNAWLPQASYPCDVPPQPNSPPDNVFRPNRPAEAGLGSKKRGIAPLPIHGISKITLKVVVFHFRPRAPTYTTPLKSFHKVGLESSSTGSSIPADSAKPVPWLWFRWIVDRDSGNLVNPFMRVTNKMTRHLATLRDSELAVRRPGRPPKEPFPVRPPAGTRRPALSPRKQLEQSADSRRGSGLGPPCPALRANPFPEVTDPFCRPSLAYIVPSTRGCSPWRPDAVMSTTGRGRHSVLRIFRAAGGAHRTPRDVRCSSSRWTLPPTESFQGGQAVKQKR